MKGVLLDDNNDLTVTNGNLAIGDVTLQNQHTLLLVEKGEVKEHPLTGVGIKTYLDDETPANLTRAIRTEFAKEGFKVQKIDIENGKINITANY